MAVCSKRGALSGRGRKRCEVDQGAAWFGACGAGWAGTAWGDIAAEGDCNWEYDGGGTEEEARVQSLLGAGRRSAILRNMVVQVEIGSQVTLTPRLARHPIT